MKNHANQKHLRGARVYFSSTPGYRTSRQGGRGCRSLEQLVPSHPQSRAERSERRHAHSLACCAQLSFSTPTHIRTPLSSVSWGFLHQLRQFLSDMATASRCRQSLLATPLPGDSRCVEVTIKTSHHFVRQQNGALCLVPALTTVFLQLPTGRPRVPCHRTVITGKASLWPLRGWEWRYH